MESLRRQTGVSEAQGNQEGWNADLRVQISVRSPKPCGCEPRKGRRDALPYFGRSPKPRCGDHFALRIPHSALSCGAAVELWIYDLVTFLEGSCRSEEHTSELQSL